MSDACLDMVGYKNYTQILQHAVYYNTSITYKYRMIVLCLQYHSTELSYMYDTYVGIQVYKADIT